MIKAVFFDIDGTLLSHKSGQVPEDTREALGSLREKGILIFTSTGRHILELDELPVRDLTFDAYVLLNGQLCLDRERKVLYASPIPEEDIRRILPRFEGGDVPVAFVEKDRIYINWIGERVRREQQEISSELPTVGCYTGNPVYLVNVFEQDSVVDNIMEEMPHCKVTRWNSFGTDIISVSGGKVTGMERLLKHFGIAREECMAFGDGENDMEMLQFAGIGVAMGNAEDEVKVCADYVTDDIDKGGIRKALQHWGLLG